MTENNGNNKKAPWHIWAVGIVGLLWSAMGAMDFVMTQIKNPQYMSNFSDAQLTFFYSIPMWAVITWGIAVWGGVIGCLLILMRKLLAVWILFASFIGMMMTAFQNYVLSNGLEVIGDPFSLIFTAVIFVVALGLYVYARKMGQKGLLS